MTALLATSVAVAIVLPHLLPMKHVAPPIAIALWLTALALRAVSGILIVVLFVLYFPATELFGLMTHWCWHEVLPFLAAHVGLDGHSLGHAATLLPLLVLTASALSAGWALLRTARAMRELLRRRALGAGPMGSVIVGGPSVLVAAAGLARPTVIVSAAALTTLDDDELAVSLAHERGHIARKHRFMLLCGEILRALGRFVPCGRVAMAELAFHIERDADAYALAGAHDRLALASAICKAATTSQPTAALIPLADIRSVAGRVDLLTKEPARRPLLLERSLTLAAAVMASLVFALAVVVPSVTAAGIRSMASATSSSGCPS